MTPYEEHVRKIAKEVVAYDADGYIREAFKVYGIEGTEQKIKEVMKGKLQEFMLARYRKIINGKTQETEA